MTLSLRWCVPVAGALLLVPSPSLDAQSASPPGTTRITAAANLTLRAMPSADASAIAQVPLGTEVADAGPAGLDKTWVHVALPDGRQGWLLARLTRTLDPVWRWPTFDDIIADRLGRQGDGFPAATELVAFIERVAPEYTDPDGHARIELARLRALSRALSLISTKNATREPYAHWLAERQADVVYDAPAKRWMLAPTFVWDLHARNAAAPTADDLAWFGVTNGLPGECLGRLPCYLLARNQLEGEYLRRIPNGAHAAEAVSEVRNTAVQLAAAGGPRSEYTFDRARDCREVMTSVDALAAATQATRVENRDTALDSLAVIRKMCGQRPR